MISSICPSCATNIIKLTPEIMAAHDGATLDCPNCEALLIIKGDSLKEFHSYIHSQDQRWPEDGHGTCYAEI